MVPATTNIAMNIASPPNAAVTGISVVRVCCSSDTRLARCVACQDLRRPRNGAQARNVEAGGGEHPNRVDPPGMAGEARCRSVSHEDRGLL